MNQINEIIRSRKSVYPPQYLDKPIPKEIIAELLENANHAPTHKLTEPWRFKVFTGEAKDKLGDFFGEKYKENAASFSEARLEKIKGNPRKAGAVIAIILHRDEQERVPEWEEIAALSCAVQNIWIGCGQYELGGYWSTPSFVNYMHELVDMAPNEKCMGVFYLGYFEDNGRILKKKPIEEKVEWLDTI